MDAVLCRAMENVTAIGVNVAFGLAVLLFFGVVVSKRMSIAGGNLPPALPFGKVPVWFYRDKDLMGIVGLSFVFYLMAMGNALSPASTEPIKVSVAALMFGIGLQFLLASIAVAIVVHRIRLAEWLGLIWKEWPWVILLGPGVVVMMWLVFAALQAGGYMEMMEKLDADQIQHTVAIFQTEKDMFVIALMSFTAVIVAPICEEVVFRGYLYPAAKKFTGPWVAGVCSGLVFAAAHGNMVSMLPLFIFGMVLAALYEFTGSIWAPIVVHFLFNGATVSIQMLMRFGYIPDVPA